jgi:hypothetical protein
MPGPHAATVRAHLLVALSFALSRPQHIAAAFATFELLSPPNRACGCATTPLPCPPLHAHGTDMRNTPLARPTSIKRACDVLFAQKAPDHSLSLRQSHFAGREHRRLPLQIGLCLTLPFTSQCCRNTTRLSATTEIAPLPLNVAVPNHFRHHLNDMPR